MAIRRPSHSVHRTGPIKLTRGPQEIPRVRITFSRIVAAATPSRAAFNHSALCGWVVGCVCSYVLVMLVALVVLVVVLLLVALVVRVALVQLVLPELLVL